MQQERQPNQDDNHETSSFAEAFSEKEFPPSFPQQLMEVLSDDKLSDIISWLPHGQGWVIHDKKRFAEEVLPNYFEKKSKWTSFTRKLNRWNFTRVTRGEEVGAYYHPLFKREHKALCMQMTCMGSKTPQSLEPLNPVALGLATPKMIEHGLLTELTTSNRSGGSSSGGGGDDQPRNMPPENRSGVRVVAESHLLDHTMESSITLPILSQLGHPPSIPIASSVPSSQQELSSSSSSFLGFAEYRGSTAAIPQHFVGLPTRQAESSTHHGRTRPPSPNPLPPFPTTTTYVQEPTQSSSIHWLQRNSMTPEQYRNATALQLQHQHQLLLQQQQHGYNLLQENQQSILPQNNFSPEDAITLTPTPAMRYMVQTGAARHQGISLPVRHRDSNTAMTQQDDDGQDISPSIFDTTSSSSDQGSGSKIAPSHSSTNASKKLTSTTSPTTKSSDDNDGTQTSSPSSSPPTSRHQGLMMGGGEGLNHNEGSSGTTRESFSLLQTNYLAAIQILDQKSGFQNLIASRRLAPASSDMRARPLALSHRTMMEGDNDNDNDIESEE